VNIDNPRRKSAKAMQLNGNWGLLFGKFFQGSRQGC
jgi:hypothetical protein